MLINLEANSGARCQGLFDLMSKAFSFALGSVFFATVLLGPYGIDLVARVLGSGMEYMQQKFKASSEPSLGHWAAQSGSPWRKLAWVCCVHHCRQAGSLALASGEPQDDV